MIMLMSCLLKPVPVESWTLTPDDDHLEPFSKITDKAWPALSQDLSKYEGNKDSLRKNVPEDYAAITKWFSPTGRASLGYKSASLPLYIISGARLRQWFLSGGVPMDIKVLDTRKKGIK